MATYFSVPRAYRRWSRRVPPTRRGHAATTCVLRLPLALSVLLIAFRPTAGLTAETLKEPWVYASDQVRVYRNLSYRDDTNRDSLVDLYQPPGSGPFPVVMLIHGGAWMSGDKIQVAAYARRLARAGFVAVAINYRLAPQHIFPAQLEDAQEALKWIVGNQARFQLDLDRLGGFGYSAGAQLICLLGLGRDTLLDETHRFWPLADATPPFRALVVGGTPSDFRRIPADNPVLKYWLGGTRAERPQLYRLASPLAHVSPQDPPVFLYHGAEDRLVPLDNSRRLYDQLQQHHVLTRFEIVPRAGHVKAFANSEMLRQTIRFFQEQLIAPDGDDRSVKPGRDRG